MKTTRTNYDKHMQEAPTEFRYNNQDQADCEICGDSETAEAIYKGAWVCEDCLLQNIFAPAINHIEKETLGEEGVNGSWSIRVNPRTDTVESISFFSKMIPTFAEIEFTIPIENVVEILCRIQLEEAK